MACSPGPSTPLVPPHGSACLEWPSPPLRPVRILPSPNPSPAWPFLPPVLLTFPSLNAWWGWGLGFHRTLHSRPDHSSTPFSTMTFRLKHFASRSPRFLICKRRPLCCRQEVGSRKRRGQGEVRIPCFRSPRSPSSPHSLGRVEDGTHLLRQVSPEDVLPTGDAQGSSHGLGIERGFQHQHGTMDTTVGQVVRVLLRARHRAA